jgi:hypothetical protein
MTKIILYHGTARDFTEFDTHFTLRGSEPNSALGIHLTESPSIAADYARLAAKDGHAGEPRVLIVEAEVSKVGIVGSAADYLGRDPEIFDVETNRSRVEFVERRLELQDMGFDAVATEETEMLDVSGCWAVFDPATLSIIGSMSVEAAEELDAQEMDFTKVEFDRVVLFEEDPEEDLAP